MSDSEQDLFLREVSDVAPHQSQRADLKKPKAKASFAQMLRQKTAVQLSDEADGLSSGSVSMLCPWDILEFKRPGLQDGVYRKLRLGKYPIEATIDLHRKTLEEGRRELTRFIRDCYRYGLRTVTVNHGRGDRDKEQPAKMKSHIAHWLPQMETVLAFHSAQQHHGGTGVVYVLLRKGAEQKQLNRERHRLR